MAQLPLNDEVKTALRDTPHRCVFLRRFRLSYGVADRLKFKDDPARQELLALYREVDALLAPYACDGTTECCQFGITGREPYPTAIEVAEVERAVRALGALPKKRSLPLAEAAARDEAGRCPLLGDDGKCRIYASRPFGCRTFFCERVVGPTRKLPRDAIQALSRRIADLSARFAPRDPLARPLTRVLRELAGGPRSR